MAECRLVPVEAAATVIKLLLPQVSWKIFAPGNRLCANSASAANRMCPGGVAMEIDTSGRRIRQCVELQEHVDPPGVVNRRNVRQGDPVVLAPVVEPVHKVLVLCVDSVIKAGETHSFSERVRGAAAQHGVIPIAVWH